MEIINIKEKEKNKERQIFIVKIGDINRTTHKVTIDLSYFDKISGKEIKPKKLILKSFEFLLEREKKEEIMSEFNLKEIAKYFPEYEENIKDRLE